MSRLHRVTAVVFPFFMIFLLGGTLQLNLGPAAGFNFIGFTFTGFLAWWMGRSYHLLMMPGLSRKARVVTDWTLSLFFPRDVAQLGTLGTPSALPPPP